METRINYHIQGIFMLNEKSIPTTLSKHLTNKIFNKPNKDAMEQVLYHLLPLTNPNCLKTLPWPITNFKEAAEFRNAATVIINNLNGFVYEKSANVIGKVNSSLLANPGGSIFVFFMYQLCVYITFCELKKKSIDVLNAPSYVEDKYIDKKIVMFDGISKSNFNEANEIISQIDFDLKNTSALAIKYKEIIQNSKQCIKDFKFELLNIEHCEVTENEIVELRKKYIDLCNTFDKNKLIAMKCARLADLILKTPENWDAHNISKEDLSIFSLNNEKVDLIELLINIKNTLNNYINWCNKLNNEEKINEKISKVQQSIIDMTEQMQCYEKLIKVQSYKIDNLKTNNKELELQVFTSNSLEKIDPRLQSLYKKNTPVILKTNFTEEPHIMTPEITKKSRRSVLLHCSSEPYNYQTISLDDIENVFRATLSSSIQNNDAQNEDNDNEQLLMQHESNQNDELFQKDNINSQNKITEMETAGYSISPQTKEDEVKSVSISRKSIENIKQKFIKIKKQAQSMSTIPHSPQSPF